MRIGIDFDNTLVCFDPLFYEEARRHNLLPDDIPPTKDAVRNHLRKIDQENVWTRMQGAVYGSLIRDARPFKGVERFLRCCSQHQVPVFIVSHKTKTPFAGPPLDLHHAAYEWLRKNGFFTDLGLVKENVFFEPTKQDKLNRIQDLKCTHFIDDLPEFLNEITSPPGILRILFDPHHEHCPSDFYCQADDWEKIWKKIFTG